MLATSKLPTSKLTFQLSQRSDVPEWLYADQADSLHPVFKYGLKSNSQYPDVPKHPVKQRLAEEIAHKLEVLASRYPELVREGVAAYAMRVQADNRMMLTSRSDERLLKSWMKLVSKLKIERLGFRYTAFTVDGQKGDLKSSSSGSVFRGHQTCAGSKPPIRRTLVPSETLRLMSFTNPAVAERRSDTS